jgi:PAP2 superfamily
MPEKRHSWAWSSEGSSMRRRNFILGSSGLALAALSKTSLAMSITSEDVLQAWYGLVLKLVRHTATYSPPLASRNFAYLGVTAYEAVASGSERLKSLAGQLNELKPVPAKAKGKTYNATVVLNAAMAAALQDYFGNTGPSGQNALRHTTATMTEAVRKGVRRDIVKRSEALGQSIAKHVFDWSLNDGGATIENMGFPLEYALTKGPGLWVPTSQLGMQQVPLLPKWGENRPFAMAKNASCPLPPPPAYGEDNASAFYKEALEVYEIGKTRTKEQAAIARFWADDPMLSPTPPGHWISIFMQIVARDRLSIEKAVEGYACLGVAVADAFIACWREKFIYNFIRPVTYIRQHIDKAWETQLITPPFPEYPSGHSVQSGAAAVVLEKLLGPSFAFEDATHAADGMPARRFASFGAAAEEAALSRLYGGIHFRSGVMRGLEMGRCIGGSATRLVMANT